MANHHINQLFTPCRKARQGLKINRAMCTSELPSHAKESLDDLDGVAGSEEAHSNVLIEFNQINFKRADQRSLPEGVTANNNNPSAKVPAIPVSVVATTNKTDQQDEPEQFTSDTELNMMFNPLAAKSHSNSSEHIVNELLGHAEENESRLLNAAATTVQRIVRGAAVRRSLEEERQMRQEEASSPKSSLPNGKKKKKKKRKKEQEEEEEAMSPKSSLLDNTLAEQLAVLRHQRESGEIEEAEYKRQKRLMMQAVAASQAIGDHVLPDVVPVESKSRPGKLVYFVPATGKKYSKLESARKAVSVSQPENVLWL